MPGFTQDLETALLDHVFGNASYTAPANLFVALSTTSPADDGTNFTEPSGNGYDRVSTAAADWNSAVAGEPTSLTNAEAVTFPQATGSWGEVVAFGLFDAASGGDLLIAGDLDLAKTIGENDTAEFAAGALEVTLD